MSHTALAALRRILLLLALFTTAMLAACGGGSGDLFNVGAPTDTSSPGTQDPPPGTQDPPPGDGGSPGTGGTGTPAPTGTVSGTAATGAPIAGALVTLKDSANRSATATTGASGGFTVDSSSLTPPFLLQVALPAGRQLFSVSTDANVTATINVTPLTDVVVRTWYGVQGQSADAAFGNPVAAPPPAPAQVQAIANMLVNNLQLAIRANAAPITDPLDLIAKPFTADGTGIDKLLDNTRVTLRSDGADLLLTAGTATQATTLAFSTTTASVTASSTTTQGAITTSVQSTDVVPVQNAQLAALDQLAASIDAVAGIINSKGSALTAADLEPFFDPDLRHQGQNRAQMLAELVQDFQQGGRTIAIGIDRVRSLDLAAGRAEIVLRLALTVNGQTDVERDTDFFARDAQGQWRFSGDGRIAQVSVHAEGRRNQGLFTGDNGPSINLDVRPPKDTVTSVTVSSSGLPAASLQRGPIEVLPTGVQLDVFFGNTGPLSGTLPAAGLPVTFTLEQAAGGSVAHTLPLNAFTTELIEFTAPTGTTVRAGTANVAWTLPTTYVVDRIQLGVLAFTGDQTVGAGFQCIEDTIVSPTATTAVVTIPATCNGERVLTVNLNVDTNGLNGERSTVVYSLTLVP
jgi:hypothetical protein